MKDSEHGISSSFSILDGILFNELHYFSTKVDGGRCVGNRKLAYVGWIKVQIGWDGNSRSRVLQ